MSKIIVTDFKINNTTFNYQDVCVLEQQIPYPGDLKFSITFDIDRLNNKWKQSILEYNNAQMLDFLQSIVGIDSRKDSYIYFLNKVISFTINQSQININGIASTIIQDF